MKKIIICLLVSLFLVTGCGNKKQVEPDLTQIRNISDLATVKAYYHNVAKVNKDAGVGITHIGEVDRKYWIEYTGVVKIGIKMADISMEVKDNEVIIKLPKPVILSHNYENYNDKSIYKNDDGFINQNKITGEDINAAIKEADEAMLKEVSNNTSLFNRAEDGAKKLITNYINEIGELSGKEYNITFSSK